MRLKNIVPRKTRPDEKGQDRCKTRLEISLMTVHRVAMSGAAGAKITGKAACLPYYETEESADSTGSLV
jgi:hypothetical protein